MERNSLLFVAGLLAVLAAVTLWIDQRIKFVDPGRAYREAPDSVIDRFTAIQTDEQGAALYTLRAARLLHYVDGGRATLERPSLTQNKDGTRTRIEAQRGEVLRQGEEVIFRDAVNVWHDTPNPADALRMSSAQVNIWPRANRVRASQQVRLLGMGLQATAGRMELDTARRILTLTDRVKADYDPRKAPVR
jgi:LPS export ABC transporter protein LptC